LAKFRSAKSKKELEKEGRTLGVELDRRRSKEDLIEELEAIKSEELPRFSTDAEAGFKEEPSEVTWNSIEEFTEAVTSTGMLFNQEFIPVNIPALYEAYKSNPEEFKETPAYKFLTS
jgi:hypothetical protein|tara:strand:+ start:1223 stop:1573 length:351 start_codon:yes stop_codon:yes gene_type:complete